VCVCVGGGGVYLSQLQHHEDKFFWGGGCKTYLLGDSAD
jgi:hypothetical protein